MFFSSLVDGGYDDKSKDSINSDEAPGTDEIEFLSPDCDAEIVLADNDNIEQILQDEIESAQNPTLPDPTKHYIKEMVNMALLTREDEKEIAIRIEKSKEENKTDYNLIPRNIPRIAPRLLKI